MNMYLYTCKHPKNKVNKASDNPNNSKLYFHFRLSGTLKDNTSLTDPVFEVEIYKGMRVYDGDGEHYHDNTQFNELLERINKINYMALPDFIVYDDNTDSSCRYYFVNNVEICESVGDGASVSRMVVRLYCHIDVLLTYRYNITKTNNALIVAEGSQSSNGRIYDMNALATSIPETIIVDGTNTTDGATSGEVHSTFINNVHLILLTASKGN